MGPLSGSNPLELKKAQKGKEAILGFLNHLVS